MVLSIVIVFLWTTADGMTILRTELRRVFPKFNALNFFTPQILHSIHPEAVLGVRGA
jgi:hypothetical protein